MKKFFIIILYLVIYIINYKYSLAMDVSDISIDEIDIENIISNVAGLLVYISVPLVVVAIIIGGIYYILAGYKKENADKGKKMIKNSIIGLIIVLVAYGIITLIINILEKISE